MNKVLSLSLATILASGFALSGCSKQPAEDKQDDVKNMSTLSIGYQKAALKLIVAKENQLFEKEFPKALLHKHSKAKLLPSYLNLSGNLGVRST